MQEASFPEKSLLVHPPGWRSGKGNCWYACTCLSLTNEPDHLGGSVFSLTLTGAGSFMKNKLIMHTKLHLQETLRCILQSSKMIRFTFCSQDVSPSYRCILNHKLVSTACVLPSMLHHHRCSGLGSRLPGALLRPAARGAQGLR